MNFKDFRPDLSCMMKMFETPYPLHQKDIFSQNRVQGFFGFSLKPSLPHLPSRILPLDVDDLKFHPRAMATGCDQYIYFSDGMQLFFKRRW
jgi:hypothetical protein